MFTKQFKNVPETGGIAMKPVVIISAISRETDMIVGCLQGVTREKQSPFPCSNGTLGGIPLHVCTGGIGKANAAASTAAMLERFKPQLVINTGCAGAYPASGLTIGDIVVASDEILGDDGVQTSSGWVGLDAIGIPVYKNRSSVYFNQIPLSVHAIARAMQLAKRIGIRLTRGKSLTVSSCSGSVKQGEEMVGRFNGAIIENMEGAAVALTCLRYGVDCLEIRGISNMVEERNLDNWDIGRAVGEAQRFIIKYLEHLSM